MLRVTWGLSSLRFCSTQSQRAPWLQVPAGALGQLLTVWWSLEHEELLGVSELESALQMDPAAFQALYSAQKPKLEDENLIFFCLIGKRGLQATLLALGLGYRGARNYAGAYREW